MTDLQMLLHLLKRAEILPPGMDTLDQVRHKWGDDNLVSVAYLGFKLTVFFDERDNLTGFAVESLRDAVESPLHPAGGPLAE